jgi:hypothetical protein
MGLFSRSSSKLTRKTSSSVSASSADVPSTSPEKAESALEAPPVLEASSSSSAAELTAPEPLEAELGAATAEDGTEAAAAAADGPARAVELTATAPEPEGGLAVKQAVEAAAGEVEEVTEVDAGGDAELAAGWEAVPTDDGKVYFWHRETDTTSWELPTPGSAVAAEPAVSSQRVTAMFEARASSSAIGPASPSALHKWQQREATDVKQSKLSVKGQDIAKAESVGSSQHAEAMRALQASVQAQPHEAAPPTPRSKAVRALERNGTTSPPRRPPPSASVEPANTISSARAALRKATEEEERAAAGSQRQEAMRKLNAKGVVPTKQAYGLKSSSGSQHSAAMAAFEAQGKDVKVGFAHKSNLTARVPGRPSAGPVHNEGSQASSARAAILAKMQGGGA